MNAFLPDTHAPDAALLDDAPVAAHGSGAPQVLVVADDLALASRWCESLHGEGLPGRCVGALEASAARAPAPLALVLHVARRLPDRLGVLRQLRSDQAGVPLLVVCQHLRDIDHVLALEMGADDVLDASVAAAVVAARLRALGRRRETVARGNHGPDELSFGRLSLHLRERRVRLGPADIALTEGEFEVLWLLASQAGNAVPRADLLQRLRGLPYQRIDRSIDCRVYRIRAKLGDAEGPAQRIRTVRNCGYLFSPACW